MRTSRHLVLVTGGSSGIGLALTRALASAGNTVVIAARDPHRLAAAAKQVPGVHSLRLDLADLAGLPGVLDEVRSRFGPISLLVNNAAALHRYRFLDGDGAAEKVTEEITTNVLGTIQLTRLALPQLLGHQDAAVVTLSSILTYVAAPQLPVYSATKAALHSFSRSLRAALADSPVRVFDVLPPLVDTEPVRHLPGPKLPPEAVARAVLAGIAADRYEIKIGPTALISWLSRLTPGLADRIVARRTAVPTTGDGLVTGAPGSRR
jgi:short-subunit dehydrogenase involved in D-alanine esterification of teichoic acids